MKVGYIESLVTFSSMTSLQCGCYDKTDKPDLIARNNISFTEIRAK